MRETGLNRPKLLQSGTFCLNQAGGVFDVRVRCRFTAVSSASLNDELRNRSGFSLHDWSFRLVLPHGDARRDGFVLYALMFNQRCSVSCFLFFYDYGLIALSIATNKLKFIFIWASASLSFSVLSWIFNENTFLEWSELLHFDERLWELTLKWIELFIMRPKALINPLVLFGHLFF